MAWPPITKKGDYGFRNPRGMLRAPSNLMLPPEVAYLSQDMRHDSGIAVRRPGSVRLLQIPVPSNGAALTFGGTTADYVSFPDHPSYDLGTKWAFCVQAKTTGTPGGTQYLASRDVTPVSSGKKTFALSINSSLQLGFEGHLSDGTSVALTASSASVVTAATAFSVVVYRSGGTLAMHINGSSTAAISRTDLGTSLSMIAGAQPVYVAQNFDGTTASGAFAGGIGFVGLWQDFATVDQLLKYTAYHKYPDPKDPRVILWAGFSYSIEGTGSVAYDLSILANNGTIFGSASHINGIMSAGVRKVQAVFPYRNPVTGLVQNCAIVGGDMYSSTVRNP